MNFKQYLKQKHISLKDAARELDMSYELVRKYARKERHPRSDRINAIRKWSGGEVTANDFYASNEETEEKR